VKLDELRAALVARRTEARMSEEGVAALVRCSRVAMREFEGGYFDPPLSFVLRYADAVGVDVGVTLVATGDHVVMTLTAETSSTQDDEVVITLDTTLRTERAAWVLRHTADRLDQRATAGERPA
jgi:predicted transcriptional regulator